MFNSKPRLDRFSDKNLKLDISQDIEEEEVRLQPKLQSKKHSNASGVYSKKNLTERHPNKELTMTLKTKSRNITVTRRKRHDPVSLFQQTSTAWKRDKFLTSRGNNKEGRKLDLFKRNKDLMTIVY